MTKIFRTILLFTFFLFCLQASLEAVTVNKIIARVRKNTAKLSTIKMNMGVDAKLYSGEEMKTTLSILFKNPDKIKIQGNPPMPSITIIGKKISMRYITGQFTTKDISYDDMQNIARPEFGYNFNNFTNLYKISLIKKESDNKKKLFALELLPKTTSNENVTKLKWFVDYRKGFIYKTEIYDKNGGLSSFLNHTESKLINNIWLPFKSEMKTNTDNGEVLTNSTYEYLEINKEIPDKEFKP